MSVKIRMTRGGSNHNPHYRIVVADDRFPRDGRFLEMVGAYHPAAKVDRVTFDEERYQHWLGKGALPTDRVKVLHKEYQRKLAGKAPKKSKSKKKPAAAAPAAPAAT